MTKEELIKKIDAAISEMQELKDEVQDIPKENDMDNVPETLSFDEQEPVCYVDRDGIICLGVYYGNRDENIMLKYRRLFKSYDYAEEYQRKTQFIADLLHFKWLYDREFLPDWNNRGQRKYYVYYNVDVGSWCVEWHNVFNYNSVVFSTEEIAKKCADWLNSRKEKNDKTSIS